MPQLSWCRGAGSTELGKCDGQSPTVPSHSNVQYTAKPVRNWQFYTVIQEGLEDEPEVIKCNVKEGALSMMFLKLLSSIKKALGEEDPGFNNASGGAERRRDRCDEECWAVWKLSQHWKCFARGHCFCFKEGSAPAIIKWLGNGPCYWFLIYCQHEEEGPNVWFTNLALSSIAPVHQDEMFENVLPPLSAALGSAANEANKKFLAYSKSACKIYNVGFQELLYVVKYSDQETTREFNAALL